VAVVGQGRSGYDIHVRRLRDDSRFRIVAVADFDRARREQTRAEVGCKAYPDHRSMLRETDAELIVVSSYSFSHAPITIEALDSGRHVLVEKPIAMNTTWADRIIRARNRAKKKVFPFHNYRYTQEYVHLREVMRHGPLGVIFEIRIRLLGFSRRNDWQTLRRYGGGVLNNTCPHFLDLALEMLESPVVEVFSDLKLVANVGDVEDHVRIIMKAKNGRIADLLASSADAFPEPKWTILGSRGTLVCDGNRTQVKSYDPGQARKPYRVHSGPSPGRSYDFGGELPWQEKTLPVAAKVPHDLHDNVYAVLREGTRQDITLEDVHEVVRITELARRKDGFYGGVSRRINPEAR
jgi:predicted dehydrogenase